MLTSNNLSSSAQPMGPGHGPSTRVQPIGPPQESIPASSVGIHVKDTYKRHQYWI